MRALILATVLLPTIAEAEPVRLACTRDDGRSAGIVTVDLTARWMQHGSAPPFEIVNETDDYITAMQDYGTSPGGMTFVIEKATGRFSMSSVALTCTASTCPTMSLEGFAQNGTCRETLF